IEPLTRLNSGAHVAQQNLTKDNDRPVQSVALFGETDHTGSGWHPITVGLHARCRCLWSMPPQWSGLAQKRLGCVCCSQIAGEYRETCRADVPERIGPIWTLRIPHASDAEP